jgi:hypothetical protein
MADSGKKFTVYPGGRWVGDDEQHPLSHYLGTGVRLGPEPPRSREADPGTEVIADDSTPTASALGKVGLLEESVPDFASVVVDAVKTNRVAQAAAAAITMMNESI